MPVCTAIYHSANGDKREVILFLSQVTVSIEYKRDTGDAVHIHWLVKKITRAVPCGDSLVMYYPTPEGEEEQLVITDPVQAASIRRMYRKEAMFDKRFGKIRRSGIFPFAIVLLVLFGGASIGYFWGLPLLGERMATHFSKEYEISLGEAMYASLAGSVQLDTPRTVAINAFYRALHYPAGYPITISVVNSDEVNAYAVPGGHIVVYSAMLDKLDSPEQLAALLGHESAHISERHSLRALFRSLSRKLLVYWVFGSESDMFTQVAGQLDALKGLAYSRSLEYAADAKGMDYMQKSHIDLSGMLRLMEMLQANMNGKELPAFLQTHPLQADRLDAIRERMKGSEAGEPFPPNVQALFQALRQ